jgi:hypothetical protein
MKPTFLVAIIFLIAAQLIAQSSTLQLKIEQVMTQRELQDTGVSTLTPAQRRALDEWLNRYTVRVLQVAQTTAPNSSTTVAGRSSCSPAVESSISGDIEGWSGETIFKLDNGQIWQQSAYDYTYFCAYHPDVTIYQTSSGCRMKVADETDTVLVKRIK